jgi:amidohydrolase
LDEVLDGLLPEMIAVRRHLHAHPEPSGEERETTRYLQQRIARSGHDIRLGLDHRGLIADSPAISTGRRIALRADIDALRLREESLSEYHSQVPGVMHACGHDAHAAILVGALQGLEQIRAEGVLPWPVAWRGIFQPAEETNQGALEMIAAGALDGVQAILALHMDPSRPQGSVGTRVGPFTAACDGLDIEIEGRGGHAARPHESIDPIAAAAQLVSSIYLFVPRAVDSHDPVVVTFGEIHAGDSPNVIPSHLVLRGTLRTLGGAVRERTKDHLRQLTRGLAETAGVRIKLEFWPGPEAVRNDPVLNELVHYAAVDLLGSDHVQPIARPSMGGEDFAHYLAQVPGCMFRLGCCSGSGACPPLHSPRFDIDERALAIGAKILARTVVLWSNPSRTTAKVTE